MDQNCDMEFTLDGIATLCEKEDGKVDISRSGTQNWRSIDMVAQHHHDRSLPFTAKRNSLIQEALRECINNPTSICHDNPPIDTNTIKIHLSTTDGTAHVIGVFFQNSNPSQENKAKNLKLIFKFVTSTEDTKVHERQRRDTVVQKKGKSGSAKFVNPTPLGIQKYRSLPPGYRVILIIKATLAPSTSATRIIGRYTASKKTRQLKKIIGKQIKNITLHAARKDFSSMRTLIKNIQNAIKMVERHI